MSTSASARRSSTDAWARQPWASANAAPCRIEIRGCDEADLRMGQGSGRSHRRYCRCRRCRCRVVSWRWRLRHRARARAPPATAPDRVEWPIVSGCDSTRSRSSSIRSAALGRGRPGGHAPRRRRGRLRASSSPDCPKPGPGARRAAQRDGAAGRSRRTRASTASAHGADGVADRWPVGVTASRRSVDPRGASAGRPTTCAGSRRS